MTPARSDFWFLPLGGCGEIGMNMNPYGHDGQWLMVDCGVTFGSAETRAPGRPLLQRADPAFIAERRDDLVALVLTPAHEDHLGAVPHLWPRLRCPIYTSAFTAEVLRRKLAEYDLDGRIPVRLIESGQRLDIGPFDVEWFAITHSIPEPHALIIRTAAGAVFHTADWKLDAAPLVGEPYSPERYAALGDEQIDAVVCDSTNALVAGRSLSESDLVDGIREVLRSAGGRAVATCFASNIARQRLQRRGVATVEAHTAGPPVHASGHPAADELADLYRWVKPALAINDQRAIDTGIPHG